MNAGFERNPSGPGWALRVSPLKRGAGYRAYDFPWHSQSIHDPWWTGKAWVSYIPGFTFRVIWRAKVYKRRYDGTSARRRRLWIELKTNGNGRAFPGWW